MNRAVAVVCSFTATLAAVAFSAGVAGASGPDLSGQTYGKAAEQLKGWGLTPVIASVVGDQLPTDDCIVTSSTRASNLDSSGRSRGPQTLLQLNCNQQLAEPGKPGNSAASPAGRQMKSLQQQGTKLGRDYDAALAAGVEPWCGSHVSTCQSICDKSGTCSEDLVNYLSGK